MYGDNNGTKAMIFSNAKVNISRLNESGEFIKAGWDHTFIPTFVEKDLNSYIQQSEAETVNTETGELITDLKL